MAHINHKIAFVLLLFLSLKGFAQQTCYQIGLNEGREIYNDAQRLERGGRCVEAVPKYWEALSRFRLARSCRDLPASHELETWENRCIQGVAACGGKVDETTVLNVSPRSVTFPDKGGNQSVTVNTNASSWRVDRTPSWSTARRNGNRLTVTCQENTETASRNGTIVITANTLTYEVRIEQAGNITSEIPSFASIKVTDVQFAGKYADGSYKGFGESLSNNMTFLRPRITSDNLTKESRKIKLDFKILDPAGKLMPGADAGYTFSEEITTRGNLQQNDVFDVSEWGANNGTAFAATGKYTFEIWSSGVNMFSTGFEVVAKPVLPNELIKITDVRFRGKYVGDIISDIGKPMYNNMTFLLPRITCDHLTPESVKIRLEFRITDPDGKLIRPASGDTWSTEITTRGILYQGVVFEAPELGASSGNAFEEAGIYQFEILSSGISLFSSSFEVLETAQTNKQTQKQPKTLKEKAERTPSSAQIKSSFGAKAGLNLANISNGMTDYKFTPEMRADFHAGVFFNLNLGYQPQKPGFLSVQPELLFSRQGFAVKGSAINFNYITVPLLAKFYVFQGVNIELGPWLSYLMAVKPNSQEIDGTKYKLSELKGGKDAGIAIGAGYDSNIGLVAGLRYQHGLSDMANNLLWTNKVIQIYFGWKF